MKRVLKFIKKDWLRKLSAIVLACLVYGAIRIQIQQERVLENVRVEVKSTDPNIVVRGQKEQFISLIVRGTKRALGQIQNSRQIRISCNAETHDGSRTGPMTITLTRELIERQLPPGVSLARDDAVSPQKFDIQLDLLREMSVPIKPRIGPPPSGMKIRSSVVTPEMVKISGPNFFVRKITEIETEQITIPDKTGDSYSPEVKLIKPPGVEKMDREVVDVDIKLENQRYYRIFDNVPVKPFVHQPDNYKVTFLDDPEPKVGFTLVCSGSTFAMDDQTVRSLIRAFVEIDGTELGEQFLKIHFYIEDELGIERVDSPEPAVLRVNIERRTPATLPTDPDERRNDD
jgi:YbbR domain-containing protein